MNLFLIAAAFIGGGAAAVFYAWMLWKNVRGLLAPGNTMLMAAGGFALRIGVCAAVFILAAYGGHFDRLVAAAAGFIMARAAAVNILKDRKA